MDVSERTLNSFFEHVPVVVYRCFQKGLDRKFQFVTPHVRARLDTLFPVLAHQATAHNVLESKSLDFRRA